MELDEEMIKSALTANDDEYEISQIKIRLIDHMSKFNMDIVNWLRENIYFFNKYYTSTRTFPEIIEDDETYIFTTLFWKPNKKKKIELHKVFLKFETFADNNITKITYDDNCYDIHIATSSTEYLSMLLKQEYTKRRK